MSGIKTIPKTATVATIEDEFLYTLVRVRRNPHTLALVSQLEAFRVKLNAVKAEDAALLEADAEASAAVQFADLDLDLSVTFVANNIDPKSLLADRLFGDLRPSELKRPVLGGQLEVMSDWPSALTEADTEPLNGHVPLLVQRLTAATSISDEKSSTAEKLANFRSVGARVQLVEDFNALRKSLFGKLSEIQHDKKDLPPGWAESFFKRDSTEEVTLAEYEKRVALAEAALEALKKQRDERKAFEEKLAESKAQAKRREKKSKLDALLKAKADLEAQEAALRADLDPDDESK